MTEELIGYADRISVTPEKSIGFKVSTDFAEYRSSIVRLIRGDPRSQGFREEEVGWDCTREGRKQTAHAGSYGIIHDHPSLRGLRNLSIQMWVFPTMPRKGAVQGLLAKWSGQTGFALVIDGDGDLGFWLGDGDKIEMTRTGIPLRLRQWYFVCSSYDAATEALVLRQLPLSQLALDESSASVERHIQIGVPLDNDSPLLLAATNLLGAPGVCGRPAGLFNGKIDRPALFARALQEKDIKHLERDGGLAEIPGLVAAWDFSIQIPSANIADIGPNRLDGRLVNMPMRAATGHLWNGGEFDFNHAPSEYGAIHFHDDDLEDAGWETDFEWNVPVGARSGFYAARIRSGDREDHIPFFVRPYTGHPSAKAVVLAPTLTYLAYGNERLTSFPLHAKIFTERPLVKHDLDDYLLAHPEFAMSLYNLHSDGSGCCYSSYLRPITNMRPKYLQWLTAGPRHLAGDLNLIDWLETKHFGYDVVTDHDLHVEGRALLDAYRVVVTGSHPEYWTAEMLTALREYLDGGGRLMYLGGNGFYWVTALDPERPHVVEVRRGNCGSRPWDSAPGEAHHSSNGELCGLWRHRGISPNMVAGVGMSAMGYDAPTPGYRREPGSFDKRAEFVFEGVAANETIGAFGSVLGGAAGDEIDRLDYELGTPAHALLLASATGYSARYFPVIEDFPQLSPITVAARAVNVRADMVYFETPNGGAVFSVGAITWCASLAHNNHVNNVSRVTENVLRRFVT
jgi:N,N-dimethylformamidase